MIVYDKQITNHEEETKLISDLKKGSIIVYTRFDDVINIQYITSTTNLNVFVDKDDMTYKVFNLKSDPYDLFHYRISIEMIYHILNYLSCNSSFNNKNKNTQEFKVFII